MVFSAGHVSGARKGEIVGRVEARVSSQRLDRADLPRLQAYYNRALGHIEQLREPRHPWPEQAFPRTAEEEAVLRATRNGDEATAELRHEYERLYRSLQREIARASHQSEALGAGVHTMGGGVTVEVDGAEVTTARPDGNWRWTDLAGASVWLNGEETQRVEGSTVFRQGEGGWERFALDERGHAVRDAIPRSFRLEVAAPGGVRETVEVHCQALPGGDFELDFKGGGGLRGVVEVSLDSGVPSPKKALEEALRTRLGAVLKANSEPGRAGVTAIDQPEPELDWPVVAPIRLRAGPTLARSEAGRAEEVPHQPASRQAPVSRTASAAPSGGSGRAAADHGKATLKPKPPEIRLRLESGVRLATTPGRLRKARRQAKKSLARPCPHRHAEQLAFRLAALSEEQLENLERLGWQLVLMPPREAGRKKVEVGARPWRVAENLLFEPGEEAEDELLLELLRFLRGPASAL